MRMKHVTDRRLLKTVYRMYYSEFLKYDNDETRRDSRIYVPIDCTKVGKKLNINNHIVFGRLYYHLDEKYGYESKDGNEIHLFAFKVVNDHKAINFPMLSAVVADLEESHIRFTIPLYISAVAFIISVVSLFL